MFHVTEGVENAAEGPDVDRGPHEVVVPGVDHFGGSIHGGCEFRHLQRDVKTRKTAGN